MPDKGTANNPTGINNWKGFGAEIPYGDVQRIDQLSKGVPTPGRNAPQRAQRRAVRGTAPDEPQPEAPSVAEVSPQAQVNAVWAQIAAVPGASDLVKQLASQG